MWKFWNQDKSQKLLPGYLRLIKYLLLIITGFTVVVILFGALVISCIRLNLEDEDEMRDKFSSRLPAMQQLEQMQRADSRLSNMTPEFYSIEPELRGETVKSNLGLSEARWREYRLWLEQAKIKSLRSNPWTKPRILYFWVNEFSGYAYLEVPPEKKYHSLNQCREDGNKYTCYVYLSPSWYLYFLSNNRPEQLTN